jgi:ferric-dicitrate binding protein FerR (iron transport regulator)
MLKLDKKESLLWDLCSKIEKPKISSKKEIWMRLEQQIEISSEPEKIKNINISTFRWIGYPRFVGAFLLIALIYMPIVKIMNTVNINSELGMREKVISLSDGSKIYLNAGSKLSYSKDYDSESRKVSLNGEAYFDVKKGINPFIISTEYAEITVLGTKFNVRSRDDGFEVGVNEGAVKVHNDLQSMELSQGEQIDINPESPKTFSSSKMADFYPGWKNNKLICDNSSLVKICDELERTYNVKINFQNESQKNIPISGIINLNPTNLESVLSSISLLSKREIKLRGDSYIVL